jgi:hypothetical protein
MQTNMAQMPDGTSDLRDQESVSIAAFVPLSGLNAGDARLASSRPIRRNTFRLSNYQQGRTDSENVLPELGLVPWQPQGFVPARPNTNCRPVAL